MTETSHTVSSGLDPRWLAVVALENARLFDEQRQRLAALEQAEAALREREKLYRSLVDTSPNAVFLTDLSGSIVMANPLALELFGFDGQETGMIGLNVLDLVAREDRECALSALTRRVTLEEPVGRDTEYRLLRRDGSVFPSLVSSSVVVDEGQKPSAVTIVVQDMSERKGAELALRESEERFRALFERSPDGIVLLDPHDPNTHWPIVDCNQSAARMNGYTREELIGQSIDILLLDEPGQAEESKAYLETVRRQGSVTDSCLHRRKDGTLFPIEYSTSIVNLGGRELVLGIDRDISERKRAEEMLQHYALHDSLTDLPNRTLLRDRLQQAILAAERDGSPAALLFLDLNRFKDVNDTFGHHYGDILLQQLGGRLRSVLRAADTVARLGGDEFAVVLPVTDSIGASLLAQKIVAALNDPFEVDEHVFNTGVSIGIALFPEHGGDAVTLMRRADVAMYVAKRTDANLVIYSPEHDVNSPARLALLRELRSALERGELFLHYQPQVDLATGRAGQVEALTRWKHPEQGVVPPGAFVPLAEEAGLMKPLTTWVLNEALRQCAHWQAEGLDIRVAVNLSARSLHDPDLVDTVGHLLRTWKARPENLGLEITESAIILDPERALDTVTRLHDAGVHISIDDFGTGYSSLAYLSRLPIDEIKVDRSFVIDMSSNMNSAFIVRSIVDLAHNLGMQVVAEGVEDQATYDLVGLLRCEAAQGYYLSAPLSPTDLARWIRRQSDNPKSA